MKQNVGPVDKIVRVVIGIGLLSMLFLAEGQARWLGLIGIVPLLTALTGNCPLYSLFGFSSCPLSKPKM